MNLILDSNTTEIEKVKSDVIAFFDQKGYPYNIVDDSNSDKICISFGRQDYKSSFCVPCHKYIPLFL